MFIMITVTCGWLSLMWTWKVETVTKEITKHAIVTNWKDQNDGERWEDEFLHFENLKTINYYIRKKKYILILAV